MNTVMDDNKVLTLVSNERVPLSDSMRMVFEINSLKNATPATVSRAGILYINETDIGWRPFVDSWLMKRELAGMDPSGLEKTVLPTLFDRTSTRPMSSFARDSKSALRFTLSTKYPPSCTCWKDFWRPCPLRNGPPTFWRTSSCSQWFGRSADP